MDKLRIIFTDTILLFLSCIVEIINYLKNKFKGILLPKKNIIKTKITKEINNYPGTGYSCGSVNLLDTNEINKEVILKARLSKFDQNITPKNQNTEKQKRIREIINDKYKKKQFYEQKYCMSDKKNEQILKDWIN
ncbi:hypothetical protein QJ854_gp655 [Moumouvirus goulette]|uniref:Uncharacterized protein n=1 Tax=Moumouvirus goulette TaxID=1247379 RepID=M1PWJ7_9VIRU|nr:hypothetical protein QJ854_gp655 [Moumouvirus goulette]AGF85127.1 hypothetical protein glt_00318 [Moumouvirus goulette]